MNTRGKAQAYAIMIDRAQEKCYFMWDALKNALILEVEDNENDMIVNLCELPKRTSAKRKLLVEVLTEYSAAWPNKGVEIIERIIRNPRLVDANIVAMETAFNIKKYDILEHMAQHRNKLVRKSAARFIHYVWREDRLIALEILESLAVKVRKGFFPQWGVLESCLNTSILILLEGHSEPDTIEALRGIWVTILDHILYRDLDNKKLIGNLIRRLREISLRALAYLIIHNIVGRMFNENIMITYDLQDIEVFFATKSETKDRFTRLVQYLDLTRNIEEAREDIIAVIQNDDYATLLLVTVLLAVHIMTNNVEPTSSKTNPVINFVKGLFDYTVELTPARPALHNLFQVLSSAGKGYRASAVDDEFLVLYEDCLIKYYKNHGCISGNRLGHGERWTGFGYYAQLYFIKDENLDSRFLQIIIQDALKNRDSRFLELYITDVTYISNPGARKVWAQLRAIRPIIIGLNQIKDGKLNSKLEPILARGLSNIRIYYHKEVDLFLDSIDEENMVCNSIRQQLQVTEQGETIGTMFSGRLVWFVHDAILLNPNKFLLNWLTWLLEQFPKCNRLSEWFRLLVGSGINLIYLPDMVTVFKTLDRE